MAGSEKKKGWIGVVVLVLAVAGVTYYLRGNGFSGHGNTQGWFVDEQTGEESVHSSRDIPPLAGKDGKLTVVREFKYSIDGGKTNNVAYWYKFTPEMQKKLQATVAAGGKIGDVESAPGELVRSPAAGSKWVSLGSDEGQAISHVDIPQGKERDFVLDVP